MDFTEETIDKITRQTSRIAVCTVPLFGDFPEGPDHFGSGVLLKIREYRFLLTAAHVADELANAAICLPSKDLSDPVLQLKDRKSFKTPKIQGKRGDDWIDLAVIELERDVADTLATYTRFLTLSDLELNPAHLENGQFAFIGYPGDRAEKDEAYRTIVATNLPYFTSLHDHQKLPVPEFDENMHIIVDINEPTIKDGIPYGYDPANLAGVSGCGLWRISDQNSPIDAMDWRNAKQIGIIHTYKDGILFATRMNFGISLIGSFYPDLRAEIMNTFPREYFSGGNKGIVPPGR